jgi:hypothetical protein
MEVRQARIELARLQAQAATALGEYADAVRHRDTAAKEAEALTNAVRTLVEGQQVAQSELRTAEVALAEARIELYRAETRAQLAKIVSVREAELQPLKLWSERAGGRVAPAEDLLRAERALAEAKARLAAER